MSNNSSVQSAGVNYVVRQLNYKVVIVQVLIAVFLYINFMLIITFLKRDFFRTSMRYIFFALTLLFDCLFLVLSDILLLMSYFQWTLQVSLCSLIYIVLSLSTFVTPITLTAMTFERYVAICMPLHYGKLCNMRSALYCILIIHGLSCIPIMINISIFFAIAAHSFYIQYRVCSVEMFIIHKWQGNVRSAVHQLYFLIMSVSIVFSYVKIMKVAKVASGENKKSSRKGLQTVTLHAFQLFLCLTYLWCPFIETAVRQFDFMLFINVRYFNYITFILAPKCLSPLIYGLRDEKFFLALKCYASFGLYKKKSSDFL
ncbi:odorant receptor 131-2-like [Myripristis murdjan]|uniref:Odorant receptor, family 91, subfamily A, member 3 n=1 Tax=Myripristis murdjan TaxID=586833 RepID=A0A667WPP4_9TELE|nr:odorant receptor 131-2-like [Myripristis murdjan]